MKYKRAADSARRAALEELAAYDHEIEALGLTQTVSVFREYMF